MENQRKLSKTDVDKIKDKIDIERVHSKRNNILKNDLISNRDLNIDEMNVTKLNLNIRILENTVDSLKDMLVQETNKYILHKREGIKIISDLKANALKDSNEINKLKSEITRLVNTVEEQRIQIFDLKKSSATESMNYGNLVLEKMDLKKEYNILQENLARTKSELYQRNEDIDALNKEVEILKIQLYSYKQEIVKKNEIIDDIGQEKLVKVIGSISTELLDEKKAREQCIKELEKKELEVESLKKKLGAVVRYGEAVKTLMKENEVLVKTGTLNMTSIEKIHKLSQCNISGCAHLPMEAQKIISVLQKTIQEKDTTINELERKVMYYESLLSESKDELVDVTEELEVSIRNMNQMYNRLNKVANQVNNDRNEENSSENEYECY